MAGLALISQNQQLRNELARAMTRVEALSGDVLRLTEELDAASNVAIDLCTILGLKTIRLSHAQIRHDLCTRVLRILEDRDCLKDDLRKERNRE